MNYLLVLALQQYYVYYKDNFKLDFPTGSGHEMNLQEISIEIAKRLISIFEKNEEGKRPVNGDETIYLDDPHFNNLVLFYEYFHGDNARGVGASHQTGWTGVVAELINRVAKLEQEPIKTLKEEVFM